MRATAPEGPHMTPAFLILRDILLLRRGPQDLPYSTQLLTTAAAACVFAHALSALVLTNVDLETALVSAAFFVLLEPARVVHAAQSLRRLLQPVRTGRDGLFRLPFRVSRSRACRSVSSSRSSPRRPSEMPLVALLLLPVALACAIWQIAVNAHILRHSLDDVPMWTGVAMVLLWMLIAVVVVSLGGAQALA